MLLRRDGDVLAVCATPVAVDAAVVAEDPLGGIALPLLEVLGLPLDTCPDEEEVPAADVDDPLGDVLR